ncbi:hypothetical protein AB8E79_03625 [Salmonella enterica]|uniref:hypothetical protein n=1 Tax=Salmonella enterica TaxID=28901 RepID=UPI0012D12F44|nr:hypothetical protein [Salmonella enterica]EBH9544724.1 hypothetical protein [Salmonella enterica subsp. enterica serovar Anatum]ECK2042450.1 hypothetical protein [Salmonella enterica subsp. enterica]EKN9113285.1 hypothetical protein [Salmonella enterica]ELT6545183.1 hypothetical protein [Salmonella enterica]MCR6039821.1 hypothetical protein [Salmonella enterica subsp. enterica]
MEFKGTKGEWGIMMDDDEIKIIQSSSFENGAGWRSYVAICNEVQCSEDAHLIAAAPDLLEALQLAEKAMAEGRNVTYPEWYGVINKARAVISKALGRSDGNK